MVERPWGWFETLGSGDGYLVKRLCIRAGQRISLQRHRHRLEHWVVVAGNGTLPPLQTLERQAGALLFGRRLEVKVLQGESFTVGGARP